MSDNDWNQLKYYYKLQTQAIENNKTSNGAAYNSVDSWLDSTITYNGGTKKVKDEFGKESKYVWAEANAGRYEYGTTIKLTNEDECVIYVQWTENGMKLVDEDTYNNSNKQKTYYYDRSSKKIVEGERKK